MGRNCTALSLKALRISATSARCSTAHFTLVVRKTGVFRRDVEIFGEPVGLGQFQNWILILRGGDRRRGPSGHHEKSFRTCL